MAGFTKHNETVAYGCSVPRLTKFARPACNGTRPYLICHPLLPIVANIAESPEISRKTF